MAWDFALVELGKSALRTIPLKSNVQYRLDDYLHQVRGLRSECTPNLDRIAALSEDASIEKADLKRFAAFFDYDLALWQFEDALERLKLRVETGEVRPVEAGREFSRFRTILAMRRRDLRRFKTTSWWNSPEAELARNH